MTIFELLQYFDIGSLVLHCILNTSVHSLNQIEMVLVYNIVLYTCSRNLFPRKEYCVSPVLELSYQWQQAWQVVHCSILSFASQQILLGQMA